MALVKCKECGKEISSTVKVCPSCGYKKKPSKLTYFIVIVIGFIVGYMYLSNKHDYSSISERTQEKQQIKSIFNELESNIFRAFVENEEMFIQDDARKTVIVQSLRGLAVSAFKMMYFVSKFSFS